MRGAYGLVTGVLSIGLLAAMFVAVHRGARGRERAAMIQKLDERRLALEGQRTELLRRIETLGGRARVVRAASALGLRLPGERELVVLELPALGAGAAPSEGVAEPRGEGR